MRRWRRTDIRTHIHYHTRARSIWYTTFFQCFSLSSPVFQLSCSFRSLSNSLFCAILVMGNVGFGAIGIWGHGDHTGKESSGPYLVTEMQQIWALSTKALSGMNPGGPPRCLKTSKIVRAWAACGVQRGVNRRDRSAQRTHSRLQPAAPTSFFSFSVL